MIFPIITPEGFFLDQATLQEMWKSKPLPELGDQNLEFQMGWGWFWFDQYNGQPRRWAGHNGGIKGFTSTLLQFLEEELTLIVLWNRDNFDHPELIITPLLNAAFT